MTPTEIAGLVERLRALVIIDEVRSDNPLARDAATALEAQAAELAEAREKVAILRGGIDRAADDVAAAEAQVAKLQAALSEIEGISAGSTTANSLPHINKIARAALTTRTGEAPGGSDE